MILLPIKVNPLEMTIFVLFFIAFFTKTPDIFRKQYRSAEKRKCIFRLRIEQELRKFERREGTELPGEARRVLRFTWSQRSRQKYDV